MKPILLLLLAPLLGLLACATLSVVPVQQAGATENPETGPAVKIAKVEDRRVFQDFVGDALTPTLSQDDPGFQARAVGRGANAMGGTSVNVLLATDSSVERIVSDAVARALRAAGFRVLEAGAAGYDEATPITLDIEQLWMMNQPGAAAAWVDAEIRVRISAPLPGLEGTGDIVYVRKKLAQGGWTFGMWQEALGNALDVLTQKSQVEFQAVRAGLEAGHGAARPTAPAPQGT